MTERRNFVGVALGKRGSGKSTLLRELRDHFPRVLTYDPVAETRGAPGVVATYDAAGCVDALRKVAREGRQRWRVSLCGEPDDFVAVLRVLAPASMATDDGFARAVGGVCVEIPELDTIAPNSSGISEHVRHIFQRGRHFRVSVLADTQAPALVNRVATSQADMLFIFAQHEPRHIAYIGDVVSQPVAQLVRRLPKYWHIRYVTAESVAHVLDDKRAIVQSVRADGEIIFGENQGELP